MAKFIDEAKIHVISGRGGNGCLSFRREKYVPRGGPNGGDGGKGGDVILVANENMSSLLDFKYKSMYRAERGQHGRGKNQHGASGEDLYISVPVGTVVKEYDSDKVLGDLVKHGQKLRVARGGKGGRGNARFATSTNQAPRYHEDGEEGEEVLLRLELKLIADAGIIGFPNAGKSTLISKISAARPKIADYPFTTLVPNLGVVSYGDGETFVVADIPGIIEGAHTGTGLGIQFLKHVERTRLLIHLLDPSPVTGRDPVKDYEIMNEELRKFSPALGEKPQIVVLNKIDITEARDDLDRIKEYFNNLEIEIITISAVTGAGIKELVNNVATKLNQLSSESEQQDHWSVSDDVSERGTGMGDA